LATLLTAFVTDFVSLLVMWSLMGAAQAGAFPCAAKALGRIFPETERARATGLLASGMTLGGAIAPVMTAMILQSLTAWADAWGIDRWRLLLGAYAVPGVLWTAVFLGLVSLRKLPTGAKPSASNTSVAIVPVDWSRLLRSWPLGLLCAQQFFRAAGMVFFMTWFPTFLQSRQGIAVVGMGLCSLLIVASYFVSDVQQSIALITLGAFCATFGGVSGYTVAISFGGRQVATVFSTMNMFGNLGAALFPLTAGWLVAQTGNWNLILFLFACVMAIDALCWAFLNPQGTLFGDEHEGR
jgi:MFS family permease